MVIIKVIIGLILIFFVVYSNKQIDIATEYMDMKILVFYNAVLSLVYLFFGFLIDLNRLIYLAKNKKFFINWICLIPTIILLGLVFIPIPRWILWFGLDIPFPFLPFVYPELKAILTVLAGVMLIRSFNEHK